MMNVNAIATRDGKLWLIHVPEIDKYTQASHLGEAQHMARELTALIEDIPLSDVSVTLTVEIPDTVKEGVAEAEALFEKATLARQQAAARSRQAVQALRSDGWTLRDIGTALGISYQRASQLSQIEAGREIRRAQRESNPQPSDP